MGACLLLLSLRRVGIQKGKLLSSAGETLPSHVCYSCIYSDGDASLGMLLQGAYAQDAVQTSLCCCCPFHMRAIITHSIKSYFKNAHSIMLSVKYIYSI